MEIKTKITFAVAGLFLVGVIATLAVGIRFHTEPGLIDGVPRWRRSDMPLRVEATSYVPPMGRYDRRVTEQTLQTVNARLGFDALIWADGQSSDIVIVIGVPQDVSEGAPSEGFAPGGAIFNAGEYSVIRYERGVAYECEFRTSNVPPGALGQVLYHGFGHCFGLAHEEGANDRSVMNETVSDADKWFSDDDRDALRRLYAPR